MREGNKAFQIIGHASIPVRNDRGRYAGAIISERQQDKQMQ